MRKTREDKGWQHGINGAIVAPINKHASGFIYQILKNYTSGEQTSERRHKPILDAPPCYPGYQYNPS
jgi:hypothetical protein